MRAMRAVTVPADPDGFAKWCEDHGVHTAIVGAADTHGIWRGKRLPVEDLVRASDHGVPFSDVLFVITHSEDTDEGQELVEPPGGAEFPSYFPRKELGFGDVFLRPDLATARYFPWHDGTVGLTGDFHLASGEEAPIAPRTVLRRVVDRARSAGFEARFGLEYEFYIFRGDLRSLQESGYQLDPIRVRPYTYGVYGGSLDEGVVADIRGNMAAAGVWIEACNPESGPGQFELNIRYSEAMRAADDGFFYKHCVREIVARHEMLASFMAKPRRDWAGSSCHVHQSLWELDGSRNVFFGSAASHGASAIARHYVGGLLATMRELSALFWPTPNSYKRNAPYSWAASSVSWGFDNRSTGLRTLMETPATARVEHRMPGADSNPYIVMAACLAGGLYGVEEKIEPAEAFAGDAYAVPERFEQLPVTMEDALEALERSPLARELLGEDFIEHYLVMKRFEVEKYRQQVSEWEVRRYLELA